MLPGHCTNAPLSLRCRIEFAQERKHSEHEAEHRTKAESGHAVRSARVVTRRMEVHIVRSDEPAPEVMSMSMPGAEGYCSYALAEVVHYSCEWGAVVYCSFVAAAG